MSILSPSLALLALPFSAAGTPSSSMRKTGIVCPVRTVRKAYMTAIPTSCAFWKTWTGEGHRRDLVGTSRMMNCSEHSRYHSRRLDSKEVT